MSVRQPTKSKSHQTDRGSRLTRASDTRTDEEIVAVVIDGSVDAFEALVRRHESDLMRIATARLGRCDIAEEAVHEAFIAAFRALKSFDTNRSFRSWLVTILIHKCHRGYRQMAKTNDRTQPMLDEPRSTAPAPLEQMESRESYAQLYDRMARLDADQADAIWMRFFAKLKFHEIAESAGVSLATAKNRVRKGLERLSRMMNEGHND